MSNLPDAMGELSRADRTASNARTHLSVVLSGVAHARVRGVMTAVLQKQLDEAKAALADAEIVLNVAVKVACVTYGAESFSRKREERASEARFATAGL